MQYDFTLKHAFLTFGLLCFVVLTGCATSPEPDVDETAAILTEAHIAYKAKEYKKVFQLLFPLAASGNGQAQYTLGYLFYHGQGVQKDERQAMQWIQRSAAQGNKKALQALQAN
jgi:TPR repeat protein